MLPCFYCEHTSKDALLLRVHLQMAHSGVWKRPYVCGLENCLRTFQDTSTWRRHVEEQHCNFTKRSSKNARLPPASEDGPMDIDLPSTSEMPSASPVSVDELKESIKLNAVDFVLRIRSASSVTISTCEKAVQAADELAETIISYLSELTKAFLAEKAPEVDADPLLKIFDEIRSPLQFLLTDKRQRQYFMSQKDFIPSDTISFGLPRFEAVRQKSGEPRQKAVYDTWQYVSIRRTLQAVLSNEDVFMALNCSESTDFMESFKDGLKFANTPLLMDKTKTTAALQLYYDDLEVTNPLGSKTGIHKEAVFYFSIKNLPQYMSRNMSNIFLVALAKTYDLKSYGFDPILQKIVDDLHFLETEGTEIEIKGEKKRIFAVLAFVNGDNLARHVLFGFSESFSWSKKPCSTCNVSHDELQTMFSEDPTKMTSNLWITLSIFWRTKHQYEAQLAAVLIDKTKSTETGIKKPCILNSLDNWHLTQNFAGDLMHDFLEGIGPYEIKAVLHRLIVVDKLFSLTTLNSQIAFFGYGSTDQKVRPTKIVELNSLHDKNYSLKQKAMQFYCLFRLPPLMIGDLIPLENHYWHFYLELCEIADMLFAQKWTAAMVETYRVLYADHLRNFKLLFPALNLIPKHHFLLHYGTFVAQNGPVYKIMVSSEQMKGNFFKRQSHIMCNFKNVPFSLAQKHQLFAYQNLLSYRIANSAIEILKTMETPMGSFSCFGVLSSDFGIHEQKCTIALNFVVCGQTYSAGQMLPLKFDDFGNVVFGQLLGAIISGYNYDHSSIVLLFDVCETLKYFAHLHCYSISLRRSIQCAMKLVDVLDYHPLDRYACESDNEYYVCLRYATL